MSEKKSRMSSKQIISSSAATTKPSTVVRAAITADIKLSRGKQLVEHNPFSLIPDPANPRPGEVIDDTWLKLHLNLGSDSSLCRVDESTAEYIIPSFLELGIEGNDDLQDSYEFLRSLAFSIRTDGLIEPIEIFLADRNNDPEYFISSDLDYGYVILEGHQRRLAAMMAGVKTVTCIEITDESMLAKLKLKHRKLRRQLSENNLRKGLSVAQNFLIVKELLSGEGINQISVKELSSIIGLNEDIAGVLKRLCLNRDHFPEKIFDLIESNRVSFKWIRTWIGKPFDQLNVEVERLLADGKILYSESKPKISKPRGTKGGAIKRTAVFKVNDKNDTLKFQQVLLSRFPELTIEFDDESPFSNLERILSQIMEFAKMTNPTRVGFDIT